MAESITGYCANGRGQEAMTLKTVSHQSNREGRGGVDVQLSCS
jgi:hypothetical protein